MKVWMIWVQSSDGVVWLEEAWDDDTTAENNSGWREAVDKVKEMCKPGSGYEYRIQAVHVPGVHKMFEIPTVTAEAA